jgi:hypothetical protein
LIIYIDTLREQEGVATEAQSAEENPRVPDQNHYSQQIHTDRVSQIAREKSVSATPRDLTEDQRLDRIIESAENVIQDSVPDRTIGRRGRVNPLPTTKTQQKKPRKVKRLQEARTAKEAERNERLQEIRATVIQYVSKE